MRSASLFLVSILLACSCLQGICQDSITKNEDLLKAADRIWIEVSPATAAPLYEALLEKLNPAEEPFRSQIIMRTAQARLASGDKEVCLEALNLLDNLGELIFGGFSSFRDQGAIDMWGNPLYRGNIIRWNDFDQIGPYKPENIEDPIGQIIPLKREVFRIASSAGDSLVTILTPPYLQNMSQTGMVIMAEVAENIPLAVEYGKNTVYGFTVPMKLNTSGGCTYFCRGIISGLEPGTTYNYRLVLPSGEGKTGNATFTTSPAKWEDFSFAALVDTQQGNTVGSHGDRKYWEADPWEPGNSMFSHMVEQDISLFIGIGDHAADGDDYSRTRLSYLDRMAAILGRHVPYFISWGNHDGNSPDHPLRLAADMPSRWRTDNSSVHSPGYCSFAFEYSGVFFVCLEHFTTTAPAADDPGNDITNGWLDSVLSSQEARDARFRILPIHVPPFCERWIDGDTKLGEHLVPRLKKYNVDICFSGHMHGYERGYLNGVHYVIAGGGSYLDCFEPLVYEWPHMFIGGQVNGKPSNVPGEYRRQSSYGILGETAQKAEPFSGQ